MGYCCVGDLYPILSPLDAAAILQEEQTKKPCRKFLQTGEFFGGRNNCLSPSSSFMSQPKAVPQSPGMCVCLEGVQGLGLRVWRAGVMDLGFACTFTREDVVCAALMELRGFCCRTV